MSAFCDRCGNPTDTGMNCTNIRCYLAYKTQPPMTMNLPLAPMTEADVCRIVREEIARTTTKHPSDNEESSK